MIISKKIFIPIFVFLLSGLLIGAFLDFRIDLLIYQPRNLFSTVMASIGELPAFGGTAMACTILFRGLQKYPKGRIHTVLSFILMILLTGLAIYYQGRTFWSVNAWGYFYPAAQRSAIYVIPTGCLLVLPWTFVGLKLGRKIQSPAAITAAGILIVVVLIQLFAGMELKDLFHRPRFRFLMESGSGTALYMPIFHKFADYTGFLSEAFTKEEFKSFPSMHTASAAVSMCVLTYFPQLSGRTISETRQNRLILIGFAYTLVIAFSRMLCGAHFLTDVCFGCMITLVVFLAADRILGNKKRQ